MKTTVGFIEIPKIFVEHCQESKFSAPLVLLELAGVKVLQSGLETTEPESSCAIR